ncbi:hypothetical protein B0H21DRAFT_104465 [Amylocystis lapponica]|nr:hypothetical protein B0H21DRAFT_104465 [Amylocystis lapponica]
MQTIWPINRPPAIFIVPDDRAKDLLYAPDAKKHPWEVSTILPVTYPDDPNLPLVDKPAWVQNPYSAIPIGAPVLVRRFNEKRGVWEPWIEATVVAESEIRCPLGPMRTYWAEYNTKKGHHRQAFMPFVGEILAAMDLRPSNKVEDYYLRRSQLNLVYIPIMTQVVRHKDEDLDNYIIFYVGQTLYTDNRCTEWHVRVLNGPYAGKVMRSTQVYSFTERNAQAIENAPNFERVFGPFGDVRCEAIQLYEEQPDQVLLPDGMTWSSPLHCKRRGTNHVDI